MSDTNQNLDINIRTNLDASGAQDAEKQLDADTESANALAEAFRQCEVRLQELLNSLNDPAAKNQIAFSATSEPLPAPDSVAAQHFAEAAVTNPPPATNSTDAASPDSAHQEFFLTDRGELKSTRDGAIPTKPSTDSTPDLFASDPTSPAPNDTPDSSKSSVSPAPLQMADDPSASFDQEYQNLQSGNQQLQSVINQFRFGWEENSRFTVSLFEQMLPVLTEQTTQLRELQRSLSDLAGQLRSQKNP